MSKLGEIASGFRNLAHAWKDLALSIKDTAKEQALEAKDVGIEIGRASWSGVKRTGRIVDDIAHSPVKGTERAVDAFVEYNKLHTDENGGYRDTDVRVKDAP